MQGLQVPTKEEEKAQTFGELRNVQACASIVLAPNPNLQCQHNEPLCRGKYLALIHGVDVSPVRISTGQDQCDVADNVMIMIIIIIIIIIIIFNNNSNMFHKWV
jgi:hypothetical protein